MNTPSEQLPKGYSPLFWKAFTTQRKKPEKKRKKIKKCLTEGGAGVILTKLSAEEGPPKSARPGKSP